MAIGGAIAGMAIFLKVELLLLLVGGIFVIEALSVILQVVSFKYWGRRVFLMAPIHHHFEMKAWSETKIMVRFWIVTGILCAAGFALFYKYYPSIRPRRREECSSTASPARAQAAAERLRERGDEVVARRPDARERGRPRRCSTASSVVVKSPGVPAERAARAGGAASRRPGLVRAGARLAAAARGHALRRRHGHEREDDDVRAARRDLPRRRARRGRRRQRRQAADGACAPAEWVVCELSSFQLEDVDELACDVAVLLNLEPDHLDRHGSFEAYRAAKLRIFERARAAVVPRGSGLAGIPFSADDPLPAEPLLRGRAQPRERRGRDRRRPGGRDRGRRGRRGPRTFPGVPHRLEGIGEVDGVAYVNDSKATNVAASLRALAAYADEPVHLILGGSPKGESFTPLAAAIGDNVRSIHLIGEAAEPLAEALGGPAARLDATLDRAVRHAAAEARPGEVVLLSPACASYDQFDDFEHRGEAFRRTVAELRRAGGG